MKKDFEKHKIKLNSGTREIQKAGKITHTCLIDDAKTEPPTILSWYWIIHGYEDDYEPEKIAFLMYKIGVTLK